MTGGTSTPSGCTTPRSLREEIFDEDHRRSRSREPQTTTTSMGGDERRAAEVTTRGSSAAGGEFFETSRLAAGESEMAGTQVNYSGVGPSSSAGPSSSTLQRLASSTSGPIRQRRRGTPLRKTLPMDDGAVSRSASTKRTADERLEDELRKQADHRRRAGADCDDERRALDSLVTDIHKRHEDLDRGQKTQGYS